MALRLLGSKLIMKPQKLGFCVSNSYRTAVPDLPAMRTLKRIVKPKSWLQIRLEEKILQLKKEEEDNRQLGEENRQLKERLKQMEEEIRGDLQPDTQKLEEASQKIAEMNKDDASNTINELFEKVTLLEQRNLGDVQRDIQNEFNSLETKLEEASQKIAEMNGVGEDLIDILSEEREWQDIKKENLRTKLKGDSSNTINELFEKVTLLEKGL